MCFGEHIPEEVDLVLLDVGELSSLSSYITANGISDQRRAVSSRRNKMPANVETHKEHGQLRADGTRTHGSSKQASDIESPVRGSLLCFIQD
jgi:hypothetical protein